MIRIALTTLCVALTSAAAAQELGISTTPLMPAPPAAAYCPDRAPCGWERSFGGAGVDKGYAIAALDGGDILIAGNTRSHGSTRDDAWILRLDRAGQVLWERRLGGPDTDRIYGIAVGRRRDPRRPHPLAWRGRGRSVDCEDQRRWRRAVAEHAGRAGE